MLDMGSTPLDLEEAGRSLQIVGLCVEGGVYCEKVLTFPTHFHVGDVGIFSFTPSVGVARKFLNFIHRELLCV